MARLQRKRFEQPVEVRHFPHGQLDIVELDDVVVGRMTHEPGWRWSTHVRPIAGTDRCQYYHVGYTIQGRLHTQLEDGAWHERIGQHNERAQAVVDRYHGRILDFTGDGFAAAFDGAGRAIRAALTFRPWVNELDLHVRMAVHTGEVESQGSRVRGLPLHVASRIMNLAGPDEILISSMVRDLLDRSELAFTDRGRHALKGVSGERHVFRVES